MKDEHEVEEQRDLCRRISDDAIDNYKILRHEFSELKSQVIRDERTYEKRMSALEDQITEFKRKLAWGRGAFWGLFFAFGSMGIFVVDQIKQILDHVNGGK